GSVSNFGAVMQPRYVNLIIAAPRLPEKIGLVACGQTSFSRALQTEFVRMGHPEKTQIFCECRFCHLRGRAISVRAHVFWFPTNVVRREMHSRFDPAQCLPEIYRSV